jgi:hypothetical protein
MGGLANKGIYKYVQICTHRKIEREGNRNYPKWGFDQGCLDMVQYLHKNLRLVKEVEKRSSRRRPCSSFWPRTGCGSGFRPRHRGEEPLELIGDAEPI